MIQKKAWLSNSQEIADYIGMGKQMVKKLAEKEGLPAKMILGSWRALPKDIDKWVEEKLKKTCQ